MPKLTATTIVLDGATFVVLNEGDDLPAEYADQVGEHILDSPKDPQDPKAK